MPLNHTSKYAELTDNQFLLIGKLTVEFSNIEFLLSEMLGRLLITPSFLSRTYTERMNVVALIEKIRNAIDIHERRYNNFFVSKELSNSISNILSEIEKIRLIRNKFAHYCWSRQTDSKIFGTNFLGKVPKDSRPNEGVSEITNIEIESMYKNSYQIVESLSKIIDDIPELLEDRELKSKLRYKR
jgi:hypothetical protein